MLYEIEIWAHHLVTPNYPTLAMPQLLTNRRTLVREEGMRLQERIRKFFRYQSGCMINYSATPLLMEIKVFGNFPIYAMRISVCLPERGGITRRV